jgi:hypothetical protein
VRESVDSSPKTLSIQDFVFSHASALRNEKAPSPDEVEKGGKGKSKISAKGGPAFSWKHQKEKIRSMTFLISNFCFLIFLSYLAG